MLYWCRWRWPPRGARTGACKGAGTECWLVGDCALKHAPQDGVKRVQGKYWDRGKYETQVLPLCFPETTALARLKPLSPSLHSFIRGGLQVSSWQGRNHCPDNEVH